MDTQAGFFYEPGAGVDAGPSSSSQSTTPHTAIPTRLTATQLTRLRNWLEDSLGVIHRGWQRRYAKSGPDRFVTLNQYLDQAQGLLSVLALIPQRDEGVRRKEELKVPYLLRTTSELVEGVIGYDVRHADRPSTSPRREDDEEVSSDGVDRAEASASGLTKEAVPLPIQLTYVLRTFALLDAQWVALLDGKELDYKTTHAQALRRFPPSGDLYEFRDAQAGQRLGEEWYASTLTGRHPRRDGASSQQQGLRDDEGRKLGGAGRALSQTDRVRLRNVVLDARARFMRWMRSALDAEVHDEDEDEGQQQEELAHDREDTSGAEQATNVELNPEAAGQHTAETAGSVQEADSEEEEPLEMEDVFPQAHADETHETASAMNGSIDLDGQWRASRTVAEPQETSTEGRHYADLFARKLDPDADDADSEEHEDASLIADIEAEAGLPASIATEAARQSSRPSTSDREFRPDDTKRRIGSPSDLRSQDERAHASQEETGVLMWEKAFSHLMAGTLRSLSEGNERQLERMERDRSRVAGRPEDD